MKSVISDQMYTNALSDLQRGCLMPWDRQLLSSEPLPESVIEPFTSQEVKDVTLSMAFTCDTMRLWMEEAKKTNYFSKRFVKLSKMIMNAVTSMARGLMTLHTRGEDLSSAPMSIQDLIGVASYHFRKSYLGVLQTLKSFPEISERLLINQISWNDMLMRLFKTRDKLAEPCEIRNKKSEIRNLEAHDGNPDASVLPALDNGTSVSVPALTESAEQAMDRIASLVSVSGERAISEPAAIREPGAFTAPRAFSSYDKTQNRKSETDEKKKQNPEIRNSANEEVRMKKEETLNEDIHLSDAVISEQELFSPDEDNHLLDTVGAEQETNPPDKEIHLPDTVTGEQETYPPDEDPPLPDAAVPPDYHDILNRASGRVTENDKEKFAFTIDEIETLLDDPVFCAENHDLTLEILDYLAVLYGIQSAEEIDEFSDL